MLLNLFGPQLPYLWNKENGLESDYFLGPYGLDYSILPLADIDNI